MLNRIFIAGALLLFCAFTVNAEVVFHDDFEQYDVENPSDFSVGDVATGNWVVNNTETDATRTFSMVWC